ncbi:MAG: FAD-dependent oxidoreductase [bacterium]
MNSVKNLAFILGLFFLVGCMKFSSTSNDLKDFNLDKIVLDENTYPVVIIGGGFGGLTSGLYLGQANIKNILIQGKTPGGAITMSHSVCNWPGEKNISGKKLAEKIFDHAKSNGANIVEGKVFDVDFSSWPYLIKFKNSAGKETIVKALSCIIATGAKSIFLNIPGETEYFGQGVSKCATCDGPFYKDKVVSVIGGGNTAVSEAMYLSNIAKKVYLIVRRDKLRAAGKIVEDLVAKSNIEVLYNTHVKEVLGDGQNVTSLKIVNNQDQKEEDLKLDGMFLAIGAVPNTKPFKDKLDTDENGYILLTNGQQTNIKGVFAVGDVCEPYYKQLVIASGQGAKAAMQTQKFLEEIRFDSSKFEVSNIIKSDINEKAEAKKEFKQEIKNTFGYLIEITTADQFKKEVLDYNGNVVVDFYAHWCYPCQTMLPIIKKMALDMPELKFVKVDVSKIQELGDIWSVRGVPTFIFFKDGKDIHRFSGGRDEAAFKILIKEKF